MKIPKAQGRKWMWGLGLVVLVPVCIMGLRCFSLLLFVSALGGAYYDPKDVALEQAERYLNTAFDHPTAVEEEVLPSCGGHWSYGCWKFLQENLAEYPQPYTLRIVYTSYEDGFCTMPDGEVVGSYKGHAGRGGDDIVVQATFSNGRTMTIQTYEGCVELCYAEPWKMMTCPDW